MQGGQFPFGKIAACVATLGVALTLLVSVPPIPWELIAYGRWTASSMTRGVKLYAGEGLNSSIAVTMESAGGARNFHVSGKVEASSDPVDMRLQRMLGHLSALLHREPRTVLVVGCGAGVTAGCFTLYPSVERIVICEIEPLIPPVVTTHFSQENYAFVKDPRVQIVYDDARHFIRTTREKFDVITSDPIHPWVKGSATLYSQEYFEFVKSHLNPGGVVTQWVPLYQSNLDVVKSEVATFSKVFPHAMLWSNEDAGKGYDTVISGTVEEAPINLEDLLIRMQSQAFAPIRESLRAVGILSTIELLGTYAGRAEDLGPWLRDAEVNSDMNLRLQFLAGLTLNLQVGDQIYQDMIQYCVFPRSLFIGSEPNTEALRNYVELRRRPRSR